MKALAYDRYGPPSVLTLRDLARPALEHDEVLVRVHAASVNSWDWDRLTGKPLAYRAISGWIAPKLRVLGADVAGHVAAIGASVTRLALGDEVFGDLSAGRGAASPSMPAPKKPHWCGSHAACRSSRLPHSRRRAC